MNNPHVGATTSMTHSEILEAIASKIEELQANNYKAIQIATADQLRQLYNLQVLCEKEVPLIVIEDFVCTLFSTTIGNALYEPEHALFAWYLRTTKD